MQDVKRFVRGQGVRRFPLSPVAQQSRLTRVKQGLRAAVAKLWGSEPESPEDPYSYVGAPKKPLLPRLSASAMADEPES